LNSQSSAACKAPDLGLATPDFIFRPALFVEY